MVQVQLGEVFKTIVYADYPEKWPTLLQNLFPNLVSQVRSAGCSGLQHVLEAGLFISNKHQHSSQGAIL